MHTAATRAHHAKHALQYADDFRDEEDVDKLALMDWTLSWKCVNHGGSNSISGWLDFIKTPDIEKDFHIVTASVINSSTSIFNHVGMFLLRHLRFSGIRSGAAEDREILWKA